MYQHIQLIASNISKYRILHLNISRRANNVKTFKEKLYKHLHIRVNEQLQYIKSINSHKVSKQLFLSLCDLVWTSAMSTKKTWYWQWQICLDEANYLTYSSVSRNFSILMFDCTWVCTNKIIPPALSYDNAGYFLLRRHLRYNRCVEKSCLVSRTALSIAY